MENGKYIVAVRKGPWMCGATSITVRDGNGGRAGQRTTAKTMHAGE
jgi:hypothetical protein